MTEKPTSLAGTRDIRIAIGDMYAADPVSDTLSPGKVAGLLGHNCVARTLKQLAV